MALSFDGEITMAGHEMMAKLMSGERSGVTFSGIRICDSGGAEIAIKTPAFTAESYSDADYEGWRTTAQATFDSGEVTSDIHKIELTNSDNEVIATKSLSTAWTSGQGVIINRHDYFVSAL